MAWPLNYLRVFTGGKDCRPFGMPRKAWKNRKQARLQAFAQDMAKNPTTLETPIEEILQVCRLAYRKQVVIGNYIVDFLLPGKLVIEADGPRHDKFSRRAYEAKRDKYLFKRGYNVLHIHWSEFKNEDLIQLKIEHFIEHRPGALAPSATGEASDQGTGQGKLPKTEADKTVLTR